MADFPGMRWQLNVRHWSNPSAVSPPNPHSTTRSISAPIGQIANRTQRVDAGLPNRHWRRFIVRQAPPTLAPRERNPASPASASATSDAEAGSGMDVMRSTTVGDGWN